MAIVATTFFAVVFNTVTAIFSNIDLEPITAATLVSFSGKTAALASSLNNHAINGKTENVPSFVPAFSKANTSCSILFFAYLILLLIVSSPTPRSSDISLFVYSL